MWANRRGRARGLRANRGLLAGALIGLAWAASALPSAAAARPFSEVACESPPPAFCTEAGCPQGFLENLGNAVEAKTGRRFFLDFPCDLKHGDKVVFILLLHGHGSSGAWVRSYFPATALKDKYRLVVATPTAGKATPKTVNGYDWSAADDDQLRNISEQVIGELGAQNIKSFWLAGHSAGGIETTHIGCNDYFKNRVDGWLSLSGGRIGKVQHSPGLFRSAASAGRPGATASTPPKLPPGVGGPDIPPACDFNFIFESGEQEIVALPTASPWAEKYACEPRRREGDVVDTKPGRIDDVEEGPPNPALGRHARPGTAQIMVYPKCRGGRIVADVLRLDKGHTEGLEPAITETLVRMMVAAPGGKSKTK